MNLGILIGLGIYQLIIDLWYIWYYKKESKKCNYNCNNCKIWDCPNHWCKRYRK